MDLHGRDHSRPEKQASHDYDARDVTSDQKTVPTRGGTLHVFLLLSEPDGAARLLQLQRLFLLCFLHQMFLRMRHADVPLMPGDVSSRALTARSCRCLLA